MSSRLRNCTRIGGALLALLGGCSAASFKRASLRGSSDSDAGEVRDAMEDAEVAGAAIDPTYARVHEILENSCSYARCHSGVPIGGALLLERGGDYAATLIGVLLANTHA